jgi:mono/diheme cytochrome c family protein
MTMRRRVFPALRPKGLLGVAALGALACVLVLKPQAPLAAATEPRGDARRGAYVFAAGDCENCHTDKKAKGAFLAGGPPMVTDFGTFFAPNITPDRKTGLGGWSYEDFHRAMREGRGRGGELLYPVFPFPAFTGMTDQDIADLWAYLKTAPPVNQPSRPQKAKAPYGIRPLLAGWRALFFHEGPLKPAPGLTPEQQRGRYLSEAVVHCQECHSPRNGLGAIEPDKAYAGNPKGPDNQDAPNITPTGIGKLTNADLQEMLKTGMTPDGDYLGSGMGEVIEGTSRLTQADRDAIIAYIRTLPPRPSTPKPPKT